MPQKKKAKNKKQMKKSINSLWTSLQTEKTKHSKASSLVGKLKSALLMSRKLNQHAARQIHMLQAEIQCMKNREDYASEVTAKLIGNMK